MEQIAISRFKATCLSVIERVRKTRQPILVTRFGEPVAEVIPPRSPRRTKSRLGAMAGTGRIIGDIIGPVADPSEWDAFRR